MGEEERGATRTGAKGERQRRVEGTAIDRQELQMKETEKNET